ncbi:MAG: hypothetical protein ACUVRD_04895 [Bacteroidia bacterium]
MQEHLLRQKIWQRIYAYERRHLMRIGMLLFVLWWMACLGIYGMVTSEPPYDLYAEISATDIAQELTHQTLYAE